MADEVIDIPLNLIVADNEFNCREKVTSLEVMELAKSIRESGLMQNVVVRKIPNSNQYQLIAGYRRTKAYHVLYEEDPVKYAKIQAKVVVCTDLQAYRINLIENIQRTELNKKEEAHACQRLFDNGMSPDEVAKELGKSRGWLQIRQKINDLPYAIQDDVVAFNLTDHMINQLWAEPDASKQEAMVLKVRAARDKNVKITTLQKRIRPLDKKIKPTQDEVLEAMQMVAEKVGYGVITRAMAWCIGGITDREFQTDISTFALKNKVTNG